MLRIFGPMGLGLNPVCNNSILVVGQCVLTREPRVAWRHLGCFI